MPTWPKPLTAFIVQSRQANDHPRRHSQGALHLLRLLKGAFWPAIAAQAHRRGYVVGWPISVTADVPALGLPAAPPRSGRVLLSWLSFAEPAHPDLVIESYEGSAGLAGASASAAKSCDVTLGPRRGRSLHRSPIQVTLVPSAI